MAKVTQPHAVAGSAFQCDGKVQGSMYGTDGSLAGRKTQEVGNPRGLIECTDENACVAEDKEYEHESWAYVTEGYVPDLNLRAGVR